ncbi:hypothetical protein [Kocuria marina]|uniref:hypothetical protein n=1 Tax=Kocuria marina TaxID=223184 RepID=UPI0011AAD8D3|nr:hypothetical protein [Kocuria indica]
MTRLQVRIRYCVRDFWIHPSLRGWSGIVQRGSHQVEIQLPADPEQFTARPHEVETGLRPTPSLVDVATFAEPNRDNRTIGVRLFAVVAHLDRDLPLERPKNPFEEEYGFLAKQIFDEGQTLCDTVAYDFMRWLRATTHQAWLGPVAEPPHQYGRGGLYYADTDEGIFGIGPAQSLDIKSSQLRLEAGSLDRLVENMTSELDIPVAQELLADAWHVSSGADVVDFDRAVLLAAIACEVHTQEFLRQHVPAAHRELLEVALRRTSTLSILLHDVFQAALNMSLKNSDRALYNRVKDLTAQRNNIVHEGRCRPTPELRGGPAVIAQELFDWLETCLPTSGGLDGRQ